MWQSRGTYGRGHEAAGEEPAWGAPLTGFAQLKREVTLETIRLRAVEVLSLIHI